MEPWGPTHSSPREVCPPHLPAGVCWPLFLTSSPALLTSLETRQSRGNTGVSSVYIPVSPEAERLGRTPTTCVASLAVDSLSSVPF